MSSQKIIPRNQQDSTIDQFMRKEINKYNKLKRQKQKEARIIYIGQKHRLQTLEKMKEREKFQAKRKEKQSK
jgi:hypothetical protein